MTRRPPPSPARYRRPLRPCGRGQGEGLGVIAFRGRSCSTPAVRRLDGRRGCMRRWKLWGKVSAAGFSPRRLCMRSLFSVAGWGSVRMSAVVSNLVFVLGVSLAVTVGGRQWLAAEEVRPPDDRLNRLLAAGEFGPARDLALQARDAQQRDEWLRQIAGSQARAARDAQRFIRHSRSITSRSEPAPWTASANRRPAARGAGRPWPISTRSSN